MLRNEDLDTFRGYVEKYAATLGLLHWDIQISWNEDRTDHSAASVFLNRTQSIAKVVLTKHNELVPTTEELKKWAMHECLHILLYDLYYCVENTNYEHDVAMAEADAAEHRIIRVLTSILTNSDLVQ